MKNSEIHIRDPFIYCEDGKYYLYGTRAGNFGISTGGFDVYTGTDLENWEGPKQIFDSAKHGINGSANWAPEMHRYNGKYYLFATFQQKNGNRGTYSMVCDTPDGEFMPLSDGALTPEEWFSLDGSLYVDKKGQPWLIFCHEHVQIMDGTVCAMKLTDDLSAPASEPVTLFHGSDATGVEKIEGNRYVTDGPFLFDGKNGRLYMIWSTFVNGEYAQCICVCDGDSPDGKWTQLDHIFDKDGGHGMLFYDVDGNLKLTLHTPNNQPDERPAVIDVCDTGSTIVLK